MKQIPVLILLLICASCSREIYIKVHEPKQPVPQGATAFTCKIPMTDILAALKENAISFSKTETGYVTELFHIDDGTVGRFNFYENEKLIRIIPFWGTTKKVSSTYSVAAGMNAGTYSSSELNRVSYDILKTRPKMVFDYAVQLFSPLGDLYYISVE